MTLEEVEAILGRPKHYGSRNWEIREFSVPGKLGKRMYQCGYMQEGEWHGVSRMFRDAKEKELRVLLSGMRWNEIRLGLHKKERG